MIKIFEKQSKVKYQTKSRPTSLLTNIPAQARDYLEIKHKSTLTWEGCVEENGKKYIKITKKE